jgi:DNA-binding GntR family transcriptional regulator
VVEAVRARDPQAARAAMVRHMQLAEQTLHKVAPNGR